MGVREYQPTLAVIGFTDAASPLEPAWPSTHRALLPIVGKAVIVHLIEQLVRHGIKHLRIAGAIQQCAVRNRLGDGSEWGLTVRYSDLHGADLRTQTLLETANCLYLTGDCLHQFDLRSISPQGYSEPTDPAVTDESAAYWYLGSDGPVRYRLQAATDSAYLRNPLMSVADFQRANLTAAAGKSRALVVPGRAVRPDLHVDWDTQIAPDAYLGDAVAIGKHCRIDRGVRLEAGCVISNGAIIGRNTHLYNVSVLPNCFIGPDTRLRDAVVTPQGVFDLDGDFWPVRHRSALGRARGNEEGKTGIPSEKLSMLEK